MNEETSFENLVERARTETTTEPDTAHAPLEPSDLRHEEETTLEPSTEPTETQETDETGTAATKAELRKLHKDLNKGLQKAFREVAELKTLVEASLTENRTPGPDGETDEYRDPIESLRTEIKELKSHFENAAGITARSRAETLVRQMAQNVAERIQKRYGTKLSAEEVYEAAENSGLPPPQTTEQVERLLEVAAIDLVLEKRTGNERPKPAPTVVKSVSAPAQSVAPAEPDASKLEDFEQLVRFYEQRTPAKGA